MAFLEIINFRSNFGIFDSLTAKNETEVKLKLAKIQHVTNFYFISKNKLH